MSTETNPTVVADQVVVTMEYEVYVNGEVVDSSEEGDPIIFLQGAQQVVAGIEKNIAGMKVGETREFVVSPEDAYGNYDDEAVVEVARSEFPNDFPLEPGLEITVHSEDDDEEYEDELMEATVVEVGKEVVTLDFNHPLAGKTLRFKTTIIGLREATPEELEHGHVHGDDDEYDYEMYDEDEDKEA